MLDLKIPDASIVEILLMATSGVFVVLWWLLRQRYVELREQIADLYEKHTVDAAALQTLQLQVASNHYTKPEFDSRVESLELAIREGHRDISAKVDAMMRLIIEAARKQP